MPMYAELHDGRRLEFPDGTAPAIVQSTVKKVLAADVPQPQASQAAGSVLRDIPRQLGLTARYGIEGLGQAADVVTEPIRQLVVNPIARMVGARPAGSTSALASRAADAVGLPSPQTPDERVIGDASRMVASAGTMVGASGSAAKGATGVARNVLEQMAARPAIQAAGAASSGAAGGAVREAGGGPGEQFAASLLGGVAGGVAADKIAGGVNALTAAAKRQMTPPATQLQTVDNRIQLVLERGGIDWSQVPERIRQGLRQDVAQALNTGAELNPDALRRLVVFRRAGVTPTVGQLTQDPGQITREQNLAKIGANSTDAGLQRLPNLQNQNTARLLQQLDAVGAENAPNALDAGRSASASLRSNLDAAEATRDALYARARDSEGRSVALNGTAAIERAHARLQQDAVGKLPAEVDQIMNDITTGRTPLTVDYQQQLLKNLYRKIRGSTDGDLRHGLGVLRDAIADADVQPTQVNPGNLPAVIGTVPASETTTGNAAIKAYEDARTAHRALRQRVEASPALQAIEAGMEPDQFVTRFVIGKGNGANVADVAALRNELSPQAVQSLKQHIARHLKDAATSSTDDITKFSNSAFRKALKDIGDEKLNAFFTPEEVQQLHDIGDAAKYMQAQPAGAAVNNSNSGALMMGKGLDWLDKLAKHVPFGGLQTTIRGKIQGVQQTQVLDSRNALARIAAPQARPMPVNPLLAAAVATPVQAGEDGRRR